MPLSYGRPRQEGLPKTRAGLEQNVPLNHSPSGVMVAQTSVLTAALPKNEPSRCVVLDCKLPFSSGTMTRKHAGSVLLHMLTIQ